MRHLDKATIAMLLVMFLIIGLVVQETRGKSSTRSIQTEEAFQTSLNNE